MSLIHWDKSVLSFHLKEILEAHQAGDRTALVGLGAILFGTIVLPATTKLGRPILKEIIKTGLSMYGENQDLDNTFVAKKETLPPTTPQAEVLKPTEVESYSK